MSAMHHFLIHDDDSSTDFVLSEIPRKFACGYNFCQREQSSTRSQSSDVQAVSAQKQQNVYKSQNYARDDLQTQINSHQKNIYHESAIRKHISNMQLAYSQHRIDFAYSEAHKLKKLCQKSLHKLKAQENKLLQQIEREMKDLNYYQSILHQQGWQLKMQKKNLNVSMKIQGKSVGVLVNAFLDVPIQQFLAIVTQIDLMKKWMPFMESSSLQKIVSRNCRIAHCINSFPIIAKRQSFFQGIGYDRMQHNKTIIMYTRSLNQRKDLQKQLGYIVHQTEGAVQLDYKYFILQFTPQSPSSGNIKMAINVDMKLSVPMFILAPLTTDFGVEFYNNVLKAAKKYKGSEWEEKTKKNPQFFTFVQKKIRLYYKDYPIQMMNVKK